MMLLTEFAKWGYLFRTLGALCRVLEVTPGELLGLEEPLCKELAQLLRDLWNARWPKDPYQITTYARLQEGFRNVILGIDLTGWERRREERDS